MVVLPARTMHKQYPQKLEEGTGHTPMEQSDSCELVCGCSDSNLGLCKSNKYS